MIGYVYKIESDCKRVLYIGSTIQKLSARFFKHKSDKDCSIAKYLYDSNYSFSNGIELLKEYEIADRKHLWAYEQLWINRKKNCINELNTLGLLKKHKKREFYKNNKEAYKERYLKNFDNINARKKTNYEKNKRNVECNCGSIVLNVALKKHQTTNKHDVLLESKEQLVDALSFM